MIGSAHCPKLQWYRDLDSPIVGIAAASAPRMAVTPCMPMIAAPAIAETTNDFMLKKFVLLSESVRDQLVNLVLKLMESAQDIERYPMALTRIFMQNTMAGYGGSRTSPSNLN